MEPIIPPISTPGLTPSGVPAQTPATAPEGVDFADLVAKAAAAASGNETSVPSEAELLQRAQGVEQLLAQQNLKIHFGLVSGKPTIELQDLTSGEIARTLRAGDVLASLQEQSVDPLSAG